MPVNRWFFIGAMGLAAAASAGIAVLKDNVSPPEMGGDKAIAQTPQTTTTPPPPSPQTVGAIAYNPSSNESARKILQESKLLEFVSEQVRSLKLDVEFQARDCGQSNAFYQHSESPVQASKVELCYELFSDFYKSFRDAGIAPERAKDYAIASLTHTLLHEVGHAYINQKKLPITGSEEDAADDFATWFALTEVPKGDVAVKARSLVFLRNKSNDATPYNAQHRFQGQRGFSNLCLMIGKGDESAIASIPAFNQNQKADCQRRWSQVNSTWNYFVSR